MIPRPATIHRSGAALIIALLILAGLMLLGLPFLFSQSSSLSGARSFQAAQAARIYSETARNLGAALATYTVTGHWMKDGRQLYTAIDQYLLNSPTLAPVLGGVAPTTPPTNHIDIDPSSLGFNQAGTRVRIGIALEDESGKLDANTMGPQNWSDLLAAVGIPDWDDDSVVLPAEWPINTGPDGDQCGELANALVHQRLYRNSYTRLEELLDVDPQTQTGHNAPALELRFRKRLTRAELERLRPYLSFHNVAPGRRGLIDLGTVIDTDNAGQLTGANTGIFVPQQAWIDASDVQVNDGTWLSVQTTPTSQTIPAVARRYGGSATSWSITYSNGTPPQPGSGMFIQAPPPLNLHALPKLLRLLPAYVSATSPKDLPLRPFNPTVPLIAWYGQQTGAVNDLPLDYLRPTWTPGDLFALPPHFKANALVRGPTERQPLDIRSGGAITIEHAATVTDPAGNPVAQESRRTVVQAVPQEGILERHWETQGQLQPLIDQRYGSQMVTWPMATARNLDVQVDDFDPADLSKTPKAETGLSFATNQTLASTVPGQVPTHLDLTDANRPAWRVNMGNGAATTAALVLQDTQGQQPVTDGSLLPPAATQDPTTQEGLYPDGVRLGNGTRLAYPFASDNKGPLTWTRGPPVAPATTPADSSMGLRSISVWFRPELGWPTSSPVTILEARAQPGTVSSMLFAGVDPLDVPHDTGNTNFFGVIYDPTQNMLVLAYGTPGASFAPAGAPASLLPSIAEDDTSVGSAGVDERCLSGSNFLIPNRMNVGKCTTWSSTFVPNRVLTCYKLGNRTDGTRNLPEIGRWYHLQVTLANGRPGGLGLILDGIAGTDVGLMTATAYLNARKSTPQKGPWPGDHLTLPGLLLAEKLTALDRTLANPQLYVPTIKVEMPGFAAFSSDVYPPSATPGDLTPKDIMPERGGVLIGDEYIRYQGIVKTGATWNLVKCIRGDRQNTFTYSSDPLQHNPITEDHALGSRVIPDGCRLKPAGTNNLYRGGAAAADPVPTGPVADDGRILAKVTSPAQSAAIAVPVVLNVGSGFNLAPARGFLKLKDTTNNELYYFYTRSGSSVTLEAVIDHGTPLGFGPEFKRKLPDGATYGFTAPATSDVNAPLPSAVSFFNDTTTGRQATITLVSLRVTSPDNLTDNTQQVFKWPRGGLDQNDPHFWAMLQLTAGDDGRCEWLRYTDIVLRDDGEQYFIDRHGWNFVIGDQAARSRGLARTKYDPTFTFPVASTVLPVQTGVDQTMNSTGLDGWTKLLSPGDLITLVTKNYATGKSLVAAVRFAATDGYDGTTATENDTVNGQFACTAALRDVASPNWSDYEIVMGSGLNTQLDLTPLGSTVLPPSAPPLLAAHDPGRLVFGGGDTARGGTATTGLLMTIDAPMAAPPFGSTYASFLRRAMRGSTCVYQIQSTADLPIHIEVDPKDSLFRGPERMGLVEIGGEVFAWRRTTVQDQTEIRDALTARQALFPKVAIPALSGASADPLDPEKNAQQDDNWAHFATLVGRGMLGSSPRDHLLDESIDAAGLSTQIQDQRENLDRGQEVMRLPVGPVRALLDDLHPPTKDWFRVTVDGANASTVDFVAPAVLVADPLGDPQLNEVIQLAAIDRRQTIGQWNQAVAWGNKNFQKWITAPWLRGLYNTPITDWKSTGGLHPIVIGWWTRYPSALPSASSTSPLSALDAASQMRSRSFPWVGFCTNLVRSRFDDSTMPFDITFDSGLATNTGVKDGDMVVELRAMTGALDGDPKAVGAFADPAGSSLGDWSIRTPVIMPLAGGPLTGLFTWNQAGRPNETDGVEVRIAFRYTGSSSPLLSDIARAANRAPLIGGAKLRFHAPLTVLATEAAR